MGVYVDPVKKSAIVEILRNPVLIAEIKKGDDDQAQEAEIVSQIFSLYNGMENVTGLLLEKIQKIAEKWVSEVKLKEGSRMNSLEFIEELIENHLRVN